MAKFRCIQHIDSYVEIEVEAEDEEEAREKADTVAVDRGDREYNDQVIANIEVGEWIIKETE